MPTSVFTVPFCPLYLFIFSLSITITLLFFTRLGRTVARRPLAFLSSQRVVVILYEDVAFITGPIARGLERGNRDSCCHMISIFFHNHSVGHQLTLFSHFSTTLGSLCYIYEIQFSNKSTCVFSAKHSNIKHKFHFSTIWHSLTTKTYQINHNPSQITIYTPQDPLTNNPIAKTNPQLRKREASGMPMLGTRTATKIKLQAILGLPMGPNVPCTRLN